MSDNNKHEASDSPAHPTLNRALQIGILSERYAELQRAAIEAQKAAKLYSDSVKLVTGGDPDWDFDPQRGALVRKPKAPTPNHKDAEHGG